MKPKHQGGYTAAHSEYCERTLVTLLRGLGPWNKGIFLTGGLVPRYLIRRAPAVQTLPAHVGTTDVDLVLDLQVLAQVEAYRKLETNLKSLGFERGTNEEGNAQHFSWRKPVGGGVTIVVDLLCDALADDGGRVIDLPGERRLSALRIPGAHLVTEDHVEIPITAELLDDRGVVTEVVKVANIVPFIVLKALAFDDRGEEKDAYDIVYSMSYYGNGPIDVARAFAHALTGRPDELLYTRAVDILRRRFVSDEQTLGYRKDGPGSYARFLADPGRLDRVPLHRQEAAAVIERFLRHLEQLVE